MVQEEIPSCRDCRKSTRIVVLVVEMTCPDCGGEHPARIALRACQKHLARLAEKVGGEVSLRKLEKIERDREEEKKPPPGFRGLLR